MATVNWRAPALNTVLLRFCREEVEYIISYGRPFSPMAGWSAEAGTGPLSPQQISNLIDYLASIQLTPEEAQRQAEEALVTQLGMVEEGASDDEIDDAIEEIDYDDLPGAAIFSLDAAGGACACARCHTRGWSIIQEGDDAIDPPDADLSDFAGFPAAGAPSVPT